MLSCKCDCARDGRELVAQAYVLEYERHLFEPFTDRQREIVVLTCVGLVKNEDIAARLEIGKRTVEVHLSRIYEKIGFEGQSGVKRAKLVSEIFFGYHRSIRTAVGVDRVGGRFNGVPVDGVGDGGRNGLDFRNGLGDRGDRVFGHRNYGGPRS